MVVTLQSSGMRQAFLVYKERYMFGITLLSKEEKAELEKERKKLSLEKQIRELTEQRMSLLEKQRGLKVELDGLQ